MPPVSYILISINLPASSEADDCGVLLKMWSSLGFQPSLSPDFSLVYPNSYLMTSFIVYLHVGKPQLSVWP